MSVSHLLPPAVSVDVDGVAIATRVLEPRGESAGDVVLCHGTPWSSAVWSAVADDLSDDHRVYLWDMPGYGESEKGPEIPVDLRTQAVRLASLLEWWGLRRPHVIAHDIGGAVALRAHLMRGAQFADLFVWDIVTLDPWGSPFFQLVAEHADTFAQLPSRLHGALVREYIRGALVSPLSDRHIDDLAGPWLDKVGQSAFYRQIAAVSPDDTRDVAAALGEVRCPVRIGWGADDPWIPVDQAYELQHRLPGSPSVIALEGVGHLAPWEGGGAVTAAVRQWLQR